MIPIDETLLLLSSTIYNTINTSGASRETVQLDWQLFLYHNLLGWATNAFTALANPPPPAIHVRPIASGIRPLYYMKSARTLSLKICRYVRIMIQVRNGVSFLLDCHYCSTALQDMGFASVIFLFISLLMHSTRYTIEAARYESFLRFPGCMLSILLIIRLCKGSRAELR